MAEPIKFLQVEIEKIRPYENNAKVHSQDQIDRIWNDPQKYVDILKEYDCILSPDFSLYIDYEKS